MSCQYKGKCKGKMNLDFGPPKPLHLSCILQKVKVLSRSSLFFCILQKVKVLFQFKAVFKWIGCCVSAFWAVFNFKSGCYVLLQGLFGEWLPLFGSIKYLGKFQIYLEDLWMSSNSQNTCPCSKKHSSQFTFEKYSQNYFNRIDNINYIKVIFFSKMV